MYESLKSWVNIPLSIKPFLKRTGTGDKSFGEIRNILCYPHCDVKVIRNLQGVEVVSNTQLYIDGSEVISEHDELIFEQKTYTIQSIATFYRDGVPDIKVVYI